MLSKIITFVKKMAVAAAQTVINFVKGVYRHAEAITVLVLASIGLNALVGELPFLMQLPMWIESPMVIPVIAVMAVTLLVSSAEWRASRRLAVA